MIKKLFDYKCWEALPIDKYAHGFESDNGKRIPTLKQKGGVKRVIGRIIEDVSPYLGSYGMGGPGFLGFLLAKKSRYPQEWLVIRTWSAPGWLLLDNKWLECPLSYYDSKKCFFQEEKTIFSECEKQYREAFNGKQITDFFYGKRWFKMKIDNCFLEWPADLSKLPPYGNGNPRKWICKNETMEDAFLISSTPYINI